MSEMVRAPLAVDDYHLGVEHMVVRAQDVEVDLSANLARVGNQRLLMPPKELQLLFILVANAGRVVRREILVERLLWASATNPNKNLDVHIRRLRQRIEPDPQNPRYIRTARGIGYIFDIFDR